MNHATNKASLSPARRRLVELMQDIHFGWIEGLEVEGGEPILDPPPRVVRDIRLGAEGNPRRRIPAGDFSLKTQVRKLFAVLTRNGDGTVVKIEIQNGLPNRVFVEEGGSAAGNCPRRRPLHPEFGDRPPAA